MPATTYLYLREQYSVSKNFYNDLIRASILRKALENDDFDKMKNLVPETTFAYLRENQSEFKRYFTARLDIKLMSEEGDFQILSVSDKKAIVWKPAWLQAWLGKGVGYQIQSYAGNLEIVAKATVTGRLLLNLLAMDVVNPKTSTRIPYWIDYTKLTIDGNVIFDKITPAWHNKPYRYNMDARAGEEIKIEVEWLPHNT